MAVAEDAFKASFKSPNVPFILNVNFNNLLFERIYKTINNKPTAYPKAVDNAAPYIPILKTNMNKNIEPILTDI